MIAQMAQPPVKILDVREDQEPLSESGKLTLMHKGRDYSEALQAGCCQPSALRYPFGTRASTPFRLRAPLVRVRRERLSQSAYGLVF